MKARLIKNSIDSTMVEIYADWVNEREVLVAVVHEDIINEIDGAMNLIEHTGEAYINIELASSSQPTKTIGIHRSAR